MTKLRPAAEMLNELEQQLSQTRVEMEGRRLP
jgi:hypothetical protein